MINALTNDSLAETCPRLIEEEAIRAARPTALRDTFRVELREHQQRVGKMAKILAVKVGMPAHHAATIGQAAALHDIGKLFVRGDLFQKADPLTDDETAEARTHTTRGHWALIKGHDPICKLAARIALEHHECWDGSGYPAGLSGEAISREARIVTICDVYIALREERPYKRSFSHEEALSIMVCGDERVRPTMFDPAMLAVFMMHGELFRTWWATDSAEAVAA